MNATTTNKTTTNGTTTQPAAAAQACCQSTADAMKASFDAGQKMFNTFTNNMTNTMNKGWNAEAFTAPTNTMNPMTAMPVMFEKMTKMMNAFVDSNTKFTTEFNSIAMDAMKNNAQFAEKAGEMFMNQFMGKSTKPVAEMSAQMMEEAKAFAIKTGERFTKMNAEQTQRFTQIMEETMACKTACCKA